jgi:serine/threonine protein phosphatase PrpC
MSGAPYAYHAHTDVGRLREKNEDSHAEYEFPDGSLLLIVADGMGGHGHGDLASQMAVRVIGEVFQQVSSDDPREKLRLGFAEANRQIIAEAERIGGAGMGTTCTATYVHGNQAWVAHIGDSRIYHVHEGRVMWRTTDHTRVQKMVEMGMLTEAQAKDHPDANVVTRALGYSQLADGTIIEPDVRLEPITLAVGDSIVMCSDGLYDDVEDVEIGEAMQGRGAQDAAEYLVRTSNGRSGHDNITCTVLHWGSIQGAFNPANRPTTIQAVVGVPKKKSNATLMIVVALLGVLAAVVGFVIYTQMMTP